VGTLEAMTVAASILLAAVVGGVVFVLIDAWQRHEPPAPAPAPPAPPRPEPRVEVPPRPAPAPVTPHADAPAPPSPLWSGWAERDGAR
jgi:hypothetical protein